MVLSGGISLVNEVYRDTYRAEAAGWDNKVLAQMLDEEWNF